MEIISLRRIYTDIFDVTQNVSLQRFKKWLFPIEIYINATNKSTPLKLWPFLTEYSIFKKDLYPNYGRWDFFMWKEKQWCFYEFCFKNTMLEITLNQTKPNQSSYFGVVNCFTLCWPVVKNFNKVKSIVKTHKV